MNIASFTLFRNCTQNSKAIKSNFTTNSSFGTGIYDHVPTRDVPDTTLPDTGW